MYLTITRSKPDGQKEEVKYDAAKINLDEDGYKATLLPLKITNNPC